MIFTRRSMLYCMMAMNVLSWVIVQADAQQQGQGGKKNVKKRRKTRERGKGDPWKGVWWITNIFLLVLIPPIFMFIKNVWQDPMTPTLIRNVFEMTKEKTLGFLGTKKEKVEEDKE